MIDGNRLQELMSERKLAQQDCADILGIPVRTFGGYKRNEHDVPTDLLCKLADMFDVTTDYLLGRTPYRKVGVPVETDSGIDVPVVAEPTNPVQIELDMKSMPMEKNDLQSIIQRAISEAIKNAQPKG